MTYAISTPSVGYPKITAHDTTKAVALGTVVKAVDPTYGEGEFVYLKGAANTVAGLVVYYDTTTGVTALTSTSGVVNRGQPLAVAMSACVAGEYGWYQIGGSAVILKTAVKVDPAAGNSPLSVHLSATAGRIMQTSVASRQVVGARFATATTVTSTTSTVVVTINRPAMQGRIT